MALPGCRFETEREAERAMEEMQGYRMEGRVLELEWAEGDRKCECEQREGFRIHYGVVNLGCLQRHGRCANGTARDPMIAIGTRRVVGESVTLLPTRELQLSI